MRGSYLAPAFVALLSTGSASNIVARQTASSPEPTAVSQCSVRSSTQICSAGTTEFRVVATPTGSLPSSYTGCHKHATDTYCFYSGGEVQILPANSAAATTPPPTSTGSNAAATGNPTAVSDCHLHGTTIYCMWGTSEYQVMTSVTNTAASATSALPASYTGCHSHGSDIYCLTPDGSDVQIKPEGAAATTTATGDAGGSNVQCHFHAGVEHCVGQGESESGGSTRSCEKVARDYNIPLRVGLLFVILATSAIGVFGPIFLIRWWPHRTHTTFLVLKQFGTGVIISTAFVHLYTHADLMFGNSCLGALEYEGTTSAIVMAGIFLSFLVEYVGKRIVLARQARRVGPSRLSPETVTVLVLEAGIIFHSILIGITLVVAGDSFFLTLFVVILFHQMFEGIALGSRIAALGNPPIVPEEKSQIPNRPGSGDGTDAVAPPKYAGSTDNNPNPAVAGVDALPPPSGSVDSLKAPGLSLARKLLLALPFALVTPVGMAIGIGVLHNFNGNDRNTILAIGTLDALSAGILVWVGVVEMWAEDWMMGNAELLSTGPIVTLLAGLGLISGMVIMSVLGKWA